MPSPTEITVAQLARLIGTPDAPIIVDVCIDDDFAAHPVLIPGSFRHSHHDMKTLVPRLRGKRVVVICHQGLKLSQGVAAVLRTEGLVAENLEGGKVAWHDAGMTELPEDKIPTRNEHGQTLWVTRHRPKIDRIACPWLIRRFVDPDARFLFVSPSQVLLVAERFNAVPFDIDDVYWSHRGSHCTFDTMLEEFKLLTEPLQRLAAIVRGADTNQHELAPESAGLLAVSLGLSRMHRDDLAQLDAGMVLYDALYRWARDAQSESHDCLTVPRTA